jgi:hypothetical protein
MEGSPLEWMGLIMGVSMKTIGSSLIPYNQIREEKAL